LALSAQLSIVVWAGHMVVFHAVGLGFEWCDRAGALDRFKVRKRDRLSYIQFVPRVLFNQTLVLLPAMWLLQVLGLAFVGALRISLGFAVLAMALITVGHDIVQYMTHRFVLHSRRFRRWHRLHHSTGASKSISACYMGAADFFLTIACPYLVPLVLIGGGTADFRFQLAVASLGAIGGLYEHSGYNFAAGLGRGMNFRWKAVFRLLPAALISSHAHGEHHRRACVSFSDGFGSPGLCDALFRTRWDLR
jgi:sterol desaturase/sphingolipid hydroxylase (fatty acid hydroxylase superfamily)